VPGGDDDDDDGDDDDGDDDHDDDGGDDDDGSQLALKWLVHDGSQMLSGRLVPERLPDVANCCHNGLFTIFSNVLYLAGT
jgi:hypothetical protein